MMRTKRQDGVIHFIEVLAVLDVVAEEREWHGWLDAILGSKF
jgi:hypothetical protein